MTSKPILVRRVLIAVMATLIVAGAFLMLPAGFASAASTEPTPGPSDPAASDAAASESAADAGDADAANVPGYPGDAVNEARLVQAEDERYQSNRGVISAVEVLGQNQRPYHIRDANGSTLVLVAQQSAYTIDDLLQLSPSTIMRDSAGDVVIGESIIVDRGATLSLQMPAGGSVKLRSTSSQFVSLITTGGNLEVGGSQNSVIHVTSWDDNRGEIDSITNDGRAYIRVVGGYADLRFAEFDSLGFWGGSTGGVQISGARYADAQVNDATENATDVGGASVAPATGDATVGGAIEDVEAATGSTYQWASALISNSRFTNNAFGLFVTNAEQVTVHSSVATGNLVDGIVFHRQVTDSEVEDVQSTGNGRDGMRVARASSDVRVTRLEASIQSGPLATGPNATGQTVLAYGNNHVEGGTFVDNGRNGIAITGGENLTIQDPVVSGGVTGIVVADTAEQVTVSGAKVAAFSRQGIAIRDGVDGAIVTGNEIADGPVGVYARDSRSEIGDNELTGLTHHGISIVGASEGTRVFENSIGGSGQSPLDTRRSEGAQTVDNVTALWQQVRTVPQTIAHVLSQPLTVIWGFLALLLGVSAVTALPWRKRRIRNVFEQHAPLTTFSRGVVNRDEALAMIGATEGDKR